MKTLYDITGDIKDINTLLVQRKDYEAQSQDAKLLIGFMSQKQLERIQDPDDESGIYIPLRKTEKGNFTLALYAAMQGGQQP